MTPTPRYRILTDEDEIKKWIKSPGEEAVWADITPELAEYFLSQDVNRTGRSGKDETTVGMVENIWKNKFIANPHGVIIVDGFMINGGHRCLAIKESGVTVRLLLQKGPYDIKGLYGVLDTGSKRTSSNILKSMYPGMKSKDFFLRYIKWSALLETGESPRSQLFLGGMERSKME
jgi:hypothetical protein